MTEPELKPGDRIPARIPPEPYTVEDFEPRKTGGQGAAWRIEAKDGRGFVPFEDEVFDHPNLGLMPMAVTGYRTRVECAAAIVRMGEFIAQVRSSTGGPT